MSIYTAPATSATILDGSIVDVDVNASAAIAGTKISPDFGSQNVTTTGTSTAASFIPTSSTAPTNGVYLPAANSVALSTGGSGRLFVDASGNVLIGATGSASRLLTVNQTGTTVGEYGIRVSQQSATSNAIDITIDSANGVSKLFQKSTIPLVFGTNDTERLRITSAGLVGIGTSSPSNTAGFSQQLQLSGNLPCISIDNTGTGANKYSLGVNASGAFGIWDNTVSGYRMYINSSGQVGIGTSTPGYLLDVRRSSAGDVVAFTGSTDGGRPLKFVSADNGIFLGAQWTRDIGSGSGIHAWAINGTERARIDSSGRLGIGVTDPGSYNSAAANLVIGSTTANTGLTIRSGATGVADRVGSIYFADGTTGNEAFRGFIDYTHSIDTLGIGTSGLNRLVIDSSGRLGIGTSDPGSFNAVGNRVVIGSGSGNQGATIFSGSTSTSSLIFAGSVGGTQGQIFYRHNDNSFGFITNTNVSALNIDSSGRLLVGTSSAFGANYLQIQGDQSLGSIGIGAISLRRGAALGGMGVNSTLGRLEFGFVDGGVGAQISAVCDAVSAGTNDYPGRLVFSTTADGAASPTERMRITNDGYLRLAGKGIQFNGDTADANSLDDYEEGTWTPTATPSTSGTITLSGITASYTKIGNTVSIRMFATVSDVSSPLGYIDISLPFTNSGSAAGSVLFYNGDTGAVMSNFIGRVSGNVFRITYGTGQVGTGSASYARANSEIDIAAVYRN